MSFFSFIILSVLMLLILCFVAYAFYMKGLVHGAKTMQLKEYQNDPIDTYAESHNYTINRLRAIFPQSANIQNLLQRLEIEMNSASMKNGKSAPVKLARDQLTSELPRFMVSDIGKPVQQPSGKGNV